MVKVGLVGCGRISNRHVDAILANKGKVKITWVCDKKEERAKALAEKLGCNYCTNYLDLNGKGLDVVSVLTPSGLHPRHVCAIAEQVDAPNILCEKPLSLTLREAYEVFRRVEKAGKRLIPVYQNRFNPIVQMMKKLIDSGKLGKIQLAAFVRRIMPQEGCGNVRLCGRRSANPCSLGGGVAHS